ncbi:hypothetical protein [uncultured Xylophilus sp.]|uniref:hypothetical protein n=1 Tax=uncultured Xylophilus sp. TaxID=296832 RepID=UPI0025E9F7C6|nr:hypothetical protein [uncultured Xylophilus sp.]
MPASPPPAPPRRSWTRRLFRGLVALLLVPVLLFEEWGWEPLAALVARLGRLPVWAALERAIRRLPPWAALLAFGLPVVLLLPVKLLALYLFGRGHVATGCVLLVGAKIAGTAVVARLFQLTQPALMGLPLFARWYPRWKRWKDAVLAWVRASAPWRAQRRGRIAARRRWRGWSRRLRTAMAD